MSTEGFTAQYDGVCSASCGQRIHPGDLISRDGDSAFRHVDCVEKVSKYDIGPREVVCPDCWLIKPCRCDE